MLIGMACGAVSGAIYCYVLSERPMDETLAAKELRGMTASSRFSLQWGGMRAES